MYTTQSSLLQLDDLLHRICGGLQLTPTQYRLAVERYHAIGEWLEADPDLRRLTPSIFPQGSLLLGTTVRPIGRREYDLDLVCELQVDWRRIERPVLLLDAIERRVRDHRTYRAMLERKNRCLRLNYSGDFHLDIVPACPDTAAAAGCLVVPDRKASIWIPTNPKGYAAWFQARAADFDQRLVEKVEPFPDQEPLDRKPPLTRVVQLLKRWRDLYYVSREDLAPTSIVLTTLAGLHYRRETSVTAAVTSILTSLVGGLPSRGRLVVRNPTNSREDLSECWNNPAAYEAFVAGTVSMKEAWTELLSARGLHRISGLLGTLFGEDDAKSAIRKQVELVDSLRPRSALGVQVGSGILAATPAAGFAPVPRNTFYGS